METQMINWEEKGYWKNHDFKNCSICGIKIPKNHPKNNCPTCQILNGNIE